METYTVVYLKSKYPDVVDSIQILTLLILNYVLTVDFTIKTVFSM